LPRDNAPGATNVEFLKGMIEDIPLPDGSVDVAISNYVINLSTDNPKMISEMFRVPSPTPTPIQRGGVGSEPPKVAVSSTRDRQFSVLPSRLRRKPSPG
jgi:ubiquinone/menaquinone biosynthesis C-methylase UbiE